MTTKTAQEVILAVMQEVNAVAKKERNASQGFSFRGIDAVVNAVGPAFRRAGGFIIPRVLKTEQSILPTKTGGSMNVIRLEVEFQIHGSAGDPIIGVVAAESFDSGDKATAKAMSVALRTFLLQALLLPTDEPDADSQSYEIGAVSLPTVAGLKSAIATHFQGKPKSAITEALETATGKAKDWSVEELAGFLDTLEASN